MEKKLVEGGQLDFKTVITTDLVLQPIGSFANLMA